MVKKSLIGFIAGIISGLFSTGGGLILVPAFVNILEKNGKVARGTAIICILPMVITTSIFYYSEEHVDWKVGILCAIGGSIGGVIGSKLSNKISEKKMKIAYIIFLLYVGINMIVGK